MEYEFDVYEQTEMAEFLLNRHLEGRRKSRMYEESEPECDCRFAGDYADASDCDLHNGRWAASQARIADQIERFAETHRLTKEMNAWMDAYYERPEVA